MVEYFCQKKTKEVKSMNKIKKIFSCLVLGTAATAMGVCGMFLGGQTQTLSASVSEEEIVNSLPNFFDQSLLSKNYFFDSEDLHLKFNYNIESGDNRSTLQADEPESGDEEQPTTEPYIFKFYPNTENTNNYYFFDIQSITFYINDTRLNIASEDLNKLITTSTAQTKMTNEDFYPEILDFKVAYDAAAQSPSVKHATVTSNTNDQGNTTFSLTPAVLTINQTGVLRMDVQYNLYNTTLIPGSGDDFTESAEVLTNQPFSYTCFLLQTSEYFENAEQDSPSLSYGNFTRTPSESSAHRYNYFYNYSSQALPYITYDANKVRLTVTKYFNNETQSQTLVYNPESKTVNAPDFASATKVDAENDQITLYFNDVGQYNFSFDLIYTTNPSDGVYNIYDLEKTVPDQKAYLFGSQLFFTDYASNQYKEFKIIDQNQSVSHGADVTYLKDQPPLGVDFKDSLLNYEPVSTDQTPLKFTSNLTQLASTGDGAKTITVWTLGKDKDGNDTWNSTNINDITATFNTSGTYFVELTYDFASYTDNTGAINSTNDNQHFTQYFYFKIDKTAPTFTMAYLDEEDQSSWKTLYSKEYTNSSQVKLSYADFKNPFHSPVTFEYEKIDFTNNNLLTSASISFNDSGEYFFEDEGIYTIKVYYGKQGTANDPSTAMFTIDRQDIKNLAAHAVEQASNNQYKVSSLVSNATNQSFVFSWKNQKDSGAKTFGKYKYYALEYNDYYTGATNLHSLITALLNNENMLATDAKLNFSSTSNSWIDYANTEHLINGNGLISSTYVRSDAGLYIFQIYDEAGNSAVQILLLDNSKPYFVLLTADGYSLITSNHTLTTDATLVWGDYKGIQIDFGNTNNTFNDVVYQNKYDKVDEDIKTALQQFASSIKTYANIGYGKNGSYYRSEINSQFAFKDKSSENYTLQTGNQKQIQFSYSVHYTVDGQGKTTFYFSTTTENYYINVETGVIREAESGAYIDGLPLQDAQVYMLNAQGKNQYYYGLPNSLTLTSATDKNVTVTAQQGENGSLMLNGGVLQEVPFVDMEGTYVFLIRDASNTQGSNLAADQKYLQYASNYQYINVTGDQSLTQIQYYESGSQQATVLSQASYASIGYADEEQGLMYRSSYYNPTSLETTLYVSFKPTIEHNDGSTSQVDKIILHYYPYQTVTQTLMDENTGLIKYVYYETLSSQPEFSETVYSFDTNGANTEVIEKAINVSNNMTTKGKYVLERTYKTGENYTIDVFDYYKRSLTSIVDRYGVLTSPDPVNYETESREYFVGSLSEVQSTTFTTVLHGNILIVSLTSGTELPSYTVAYKASADGKATIVTPSKDSVTTHFYNFDGEIYSYDIYLGAPTEEEINNGTTSPISKYDENVQANDYYKATIISNESMESIVGGDIMINMYDGISPNSGVISVSIPYYNEETLLPSGDSFYTENKTNWLDSDSVNTTLNTNKLPVSLYIPEVKYTLYNQSDIEISDGSTIFTNIANDYLSRFNEDDEYSIISQYQIVAQISFVSSSGAESHTYTSRSGSDGYLAFYDEQGNLVPNFTQSGIYYVTITQGYNSDSNSSNNFRKNYKFAFEIEATKPDFDLTASGSPLSSLDEKLTNEDTKYTPNYYTNSKIVTVAWEDFNSRYLANIDKNNITLTYSKSGIPYTRTISIVNGKINVVGEYDDKETLLASLSYSQSGLMNYLNINLDTLGYYQNGASLSVTMQFEGHNDDYYDKTTKNVIVDKQASYDTIGSLISALQPLSSSNLQLNDRTLRNYFDIEGKTVSTPQEATYNSSVNLGNFKYYSYLVNQTFFETLRGKAIENKNSYGSYNGGTINAYYRQVEPYTTSFTETSYDNFAASAFTNMETDGIYLNPNTYYEIVEEDLAGNLTIYIVYYYSVDDGNGIATGEEILNQGITFTDHQTQKLANDSQILSGKLNLYSSTDFAINKLNFQGDAWIIMSVEGKQYMLSPWLDSSSVYDIASMSVVSMASIFQNYTSSTSPISLQFSNRFDGSMCPVNLTLLDGVQLNTSLSNSAAQEYVNVSYSSHVYPTKVQVYNNNILIYTSDNDPNTVSNLYNPSYLYTSGWESSDTIIATNQAAYSRFNFAFASLPQNGSKIKYEITDNFGNVIKLVHIFGQDNFQEITSEGNRYEAQINDATTGGELETYYISPVRLNYTFNNQINHVVVKIWNGVTWADARNGVDFNYSTNGNITTYAFSNLSDQDLFNLKFKIVVFEKSEDETIPDGDESLFIKNVYFQIYNMLPHLLDKDENANDFVSNLKFSDNYGENVTYDILTDDSNQRVNIGGKIYTITSAGQTFASRLTLTYSDSSNFDYAFSVGVYKEDGSMGSNFVDTTSGATYSESGIYYFLVKYNSTLTEEYRLYKIEILDSSTEFYRVTNNGKTVEKAGSYYKDANGIEHSEYYIVNVNYNTSASLVEILPNDYQNIYVSQVSDPIVEGENVVTVEYLVTNYTDGGITPPSVGVSPFKRSVFITYIPPTSLPVTEAYFTYNSAEQTDLLSSSNIFAAVSKENLDLKSLKLTFSKSYGIEENLIKISILKDGVEYFPEVKYETSQTKQLAYVELDRSGTYMISFTDTAGNQQIFANGTSGASHTLKLVFLKDVSYSMTFTDANGVQQTTDPIQKGVFNNSVTLTLINPNEYYTAQSTGSGKAMISVTRNGADYEDFEYDAQTSAFTFTQPGYYEVHFSATASSGIELREEDYCFTIVNPNESRYSHEFAPYDGYYIKSIIKDNLGDISKTADGKVPDALKANNQTVVVDGIEYLKNIVTSFHDAATGEGKYIITIATNKTLNRDDYTTPTEFSFTYWINTSSVPIDVSETEGTSTSKNITVSFNAERVFEAVGECNVYIYDSVYHISADTITNLGLVTKQITTSGTHYITVKSMSGNLLYSYKVIKTEPLNAWAIAAIVVGGIVAIAVVIIIIKTRKRIKVK